MSNFLFRSYWLKFQKTLGETAVDVASIRKRLEEEPLALLGAAVGVQGWKLGDELANATQHGAHLHQVWPAGSRRQIVQKHSMRRFSTRRTWPALAQATPAASTRRLGKQGWRVRCGRVASSCQVGTSVGGAVHGKCDTLLAHAGLGPSVSDM